MTIPTSQALEASKTALEKIANLGEGVQGIAGARAVARQALADLSQVMSEPWKPCALRDLTCDGKFHRGWDGHDPYCQRCPRPKPEAEALAHKLLGEFCACYAEAWPANTCAVEAKKLSDRLADLSHVPEGEEGGSLLPVVQPDAWELAMGDVAASGGLPEAAYAQREGIMDIIEEAIQDATMAGEYSRPDLERYASAVMSIAPTLQQASTGGSELKAPSLTPQDGWRPDREAIITEINMCILPKRIRAANPHARFVKNVVEADIIVCIADAILARPSANSGVG